MEKQETPNYLPALTEGGVQFHSMVQGARDRGIKMNIKIPREFVIPTISFRNKPEKKEVKSTFKRSDIKGKFRNRKCTS